AFTESDDVKHIRSLSQRLSRYLNVKPAGESKYHQGRKELKKKGVSFKTSRTLVAGMRKASAPKRGRTQARKAKKSRAKAKARTASRSRARGR
ncbi:MAG: hypothetical protein KJO07_13050, partial [Deltaproteobacteria bacterium]|nr:hypothetical protein [Deltaproteobacteria bacterium]